jgi:hypothetical protein
MSPPNCPSYFVLAIRIASISAAIFTKYWWKRITLSQPLQWFKVLVSNVIMNHDSNVATMQKPCNTLTPLRWKILHTQGLSKKWPFNFVLSLLKFNFEKDDIHFFPMKLVNGFM